MLWENERVTVWWDNWLNGVIQPTHRHRYDMAGVYFVRGQIVVTRPGEELNLNRRPSDPNRPASNEPRPYFQRKGVTHREVGIDPTNQVAIMIDIKDVWQPAWPAGNIPTAFPRDGAQKPAIDNDRVIEWDYTWHPGKKVPMHVHDRDSVQVFVTDGRIRTTKYDGTGNKQDGTVEEITFSMGDTRWIPRGTVDEEEGVSGSPRAVTFELR